MALKQKRRIIVLCDRYLRSDELNRLRPLLESRDYNIIGCLVDDRPNKPYLLKLWESVKRGRGMYSLVVIFKLVFSAPKIYDSKGVIRDYGIRLLQAKNPYKTENLKRIRKLRPDAMVLINGFGIVKKELINASNGILSLHGGDMRKYRGLSCGFWAIYNGETEMVLTVQNMDYGIDNGTPIIEKRIPLKKTDSLKDLHLKCQPHLHNIFIEALDKFFSADFQPKKIERFGRLHTLPTSLEWSIFWLKLFYRRFFSLFAS